MNVRCVDCLMGKYIDRIPEGIPERTAKAYREAVRGILADPDPLLTAPEANGRLQNVRKEILGEEPRDFTHIKYHFNELMLSFEQTLAQRIRDAEDPLELAIQYAMTGNFIDFSALETVEEDKLLELLGKAVEIPVDREVLEALREKVMASRKLTFITDNCGEIAMDKLLIREILTMNPALEVTVMVRGGRAGNDACMEDAEQVGLTEPLQLIKDEPCGSGHIGDESVGNEPVSSERFAKVRVIGSGAAVEGAILRCMSAEALSAVAGADAVIAKGQANYESLGGSGYPVFYIFMCKCSLFTERFGVPQFGGILTREE